MTVDEQTLKEARNKVRALNRRYRNVIDALKQAKSHLRRLEDEHKELVGTAWAPGGTLTRAQHQLQSLEQDFLFEKKPLVVWRTPPRRTSAASLARPYRIVKITEKRVYVSPHRHSHTIYSRETGYQQTDKEQRFQKIDVAACERAFYKYSLESK